MGDSLKNIKDLENLDDSEELIKLANDLNEGRIDMDSLTEKITDKSIDELTEKVMIGCYIYNIYRRSKRVRRR